MFTAKRSMVLFANDAPELPHLDWLEGLYAKKVKLRRGELIVITGRSGTQKSALTMAMCIDWNIPTLYFAGDMSPSDVSYRLAENMMNMPREPVEDQLVNHGPMRDEILAELGKLNLQFSYGGISWPGIDAEIQAYVELYDAYPELIVIDNLMDIEGGETDYASQAENMSELKRLCEAIGCTMIVLHHASEGDGRAVHECPPRSSLKNKLSEKPEVILGVALSPGTNEFRIAPLKGRGFPCDPSGNTYARLRAMPEVCRFEKVDAKPIVHAH